MPAKHLFEYATIRVVPRVEREEFLNVGVVVYCRDKKYLQVKYVVDEQRLQAVYADIDVEEVKLRLAAFEQICCGKPLGGPIGELPIASRFRWLTSARSTIVQLSPVHPGLSADIDIALERLFDQLVK